MIEKTALPLVASYQSGRAVFEIHASHEQRESPPAKDPLVDPLHRGLYTSNLFCSKRDIVYIKK